MKSRPHCSTKWSSFSTPVHTAEGQREEGLFRGLPRAEVLAPGKKGAELHGPPALVPPRLAVRSGGAHASGKHQNLGPGWVRGDRRQRAYGPIPHGRPSRSQGAAAAVGDSEGFRAGSPVPLEVDNPGVELPVAGGEYRYNLVGFFGQAISLVGRYGGHGRHGRPRNNRGDYQQRGQVMSVLFTRHPSSASGPASWSPLVASQPSPLASRRRSYFGRVQVRSADAPPETPGKNSDEAASLVSADDRNRPADRRPATAETAGLHKGVPPLAP